MRVTLKGLKTCYLFHEREKRRIYNQRVKEIEHGSFSPIVLNALGGLSPTAEVVYKRIAALVPRSLIRNTYPIVLWWDGSGVTFLFPSAFHLHVAERVSTEDPHHWLYLNLSRCCRGNGFRITPLKLSHPLFFPSLLCYSLFTAGLLFNSLVPN